jgi:hypothetical protein
MKPKFKQNSNLEVFRTQLLDYVAESLSAIVPGNVINIVNSDKVEAKIDQQTSIIIEKVIPKITEAYTAINQQLLNGLAATVANAIQYSETWSVQSVTDGKPVTYTYNLTTGDKQVVAILSCDDPTGETKLYTIFNNNTAQVVTENQTFTLTPIGNPGYSKVVTGMHKPQLDLADDYHIKATDNPQYVQTSYWAVQQFFLETVSNGKALIKAENKRILVSTGCLPAYNCSGLVDHNTSRFD